MTTTTAQPRSAAQQSRTVMPVLFAISAAHMLNDSMQAVVPALYPILEQSLNLSFVQVGWIGFMLNITASVTQPMIGSFTDRRPWPLILPLGMILSLIGMLGIALAPQFWYLLVAVVFLGLGSAIFHPEASRMVFLAAGNRRGFAQSVFQVGGNAGSSLAPLMTIFIFVQYGQFGAIWGTLIAGFAIAILFGLLPWYKRRRAEFEAERAQRAAAGTKANSPFAERLAQQQVKYGIGILIFLIFVRSMYHSGISSYYQFFVAEHYGMTIKEAQLPIFLFLGAGVIGTYFGGVLADRFGLKKLIVFSIAGSAPFALILPYLPMYAVYPVITIMGFIILSGFSVSVVYAQFLMPTKVGMASGLTTGLAFGMGAIGAVLLGKGADMFGLSSVMIACSFFPLLGLAALLLPSDRASKA